MILPKGQPIFEEIPSSRVHLGNLLEYLKEGHFSGFLELMEENTKGTILFQQGRIIDLSFSSNLKIEPDAVNGSNAFPFILNLSKSSAAKINLYRFNPAMVEAFATTAAKERISQNLNTDFVDIHRVLAHLGKRRFTGHMDMKFSDGKLIAYIFFQNGKAVDCFFFSKNSRNTRSGLHILSHVIQHAAKVGASLNIYKRTGPPKPMEVGSTTNPEREKVVDFLQYSFQLIYSRLKKQKGEHRFEQLFTDACIALTGQYPFMHPFAEMVTYANGNLSIDPETDLMEVMTALNGCLDHTFKAIGTEKVDPLPAIRTDIKQAWDGQFQDLGAWQIDQALPILFDAN
jgi:hypothetical protein